MCVCVCVCVCRGWGGGGGGGVDRRVGGLVVYQSKSSSRAKMAMFQSGRCGLVVGVSTPIKHVCTERGGLRGVGGGGGEGRGWGVITYRNAVTKPRLHPRKTPHLMLHSL